LSADADRFFLYPAASRDLRLATAFHHERERDIGADFVDAIDAALAKIVRLPSAGRSGTAGIGIASGRFPFTIAYRVGGVQVAVAAAVVLAFRSEPRR
jgi:hypothetical protein